MGSAGAGGGQTGAASGIGHGGIGGTNSAGDAGNAAISGQGGLAGGGAGVGVAGTAGTSSPDGGAGMGGVAGVAGGAGRGGDGTGGAEPTCSPACNTTTQTCVGSKCLLNDGQMCSLGSQCASAACTAFYLDQDGDGYGSGGAVGFCGIAPPVGYTTQNGDCCDDPAHLAVSKLIHPGAGYQTASAGGVCDITWDYDCSGVVEQSAQQVSCPTFFACPDCSSDNSFATFVNFPDIYCGVQTEACTACGNGFACFTGDSCVETNCSTITLGCR